MSGSPRVIISTVTKKRLRDVGVEFIKHVFTASDGETYAVGRMLGILLLLFGLAAPTGVAVYMMVWHEPTMDEWVDFITAMTLYVPALSASVVGLITLTSPTEPKAQEEGFQADV